MCGFVSRFVDDNYRFPTHKKQNPPIKKKKKNRIENERVLFLH